MKPSQGNPYNDWTPQDVQEKMDAQAFAIIAEDLKDPVPELTRRDIQILLILGICVCIGWAVSKVF